MIIWISIAIVISYLFLIGSFIFGFDRVEAFFIKNYTESKTKFSIIIPFRNEAENLPALLKSIQTLDYPKTLFEIIFINDESEDNSVKIIESYLLKTKLNIKLINNERKTNSPKKDAISKAISIAKQNWIITTDADCILPKYWLQSFDAYIQKHPEIKSLVAPIAYYNANNFIERFQIMEMLCLQASTIGGFGINKPFLCNGANFVYKKDAFKKVKGYEGNFNLASGDDVFLLEKIAKAYPNLLHYLKCEHAIVLTKAQPNWSQLISQRVRWASKTSFYNILFGKLTGFIVLLTNAMLVVACVLALLGLFSFKSFGYLLIIKFSIDFWLLLKSASFFNQKYILKSYLVSFLVYPFFSTYIGFLSVFSNYKWKGRTFKK